MHKTVVIEQSREHIIIQTFQQLGVAYNKALNFFFDEPQSTQLNRVEHDIDTTTCCSKSNKGRGTQSNRAKHNELDHLFNCNWT